MEEASQYLLKDCEEISKLLKQPITHHSPLVFVSHTAMFFILSKTLGLLTVPFYWLLGGLCYALWCSTQPKQKRVLGALLAMLLLTGNAFLTNEIFLWWEVPPTPFGHVEAGRYEVAVVLTGVTSDRKSPKDRLYFHKGADRVLYALRLYREGKVRKILISGAEFTRTGELMPAQRSLKEAFLLAGVPPNDIWVEARSRNTHENAMYSAAMLRQHAPQARCLLVTSAFHMRRALACFRKQGIEAQGFSADFYSEDHNFEPAHLLVPAEDGLGRWAILLKEWVGYAVYALLGYL